MMVDSLIRLPPHAPGRAPTLRETLDFQVATLREAHRHRQPEAATLLRGHGLAKGADDAIFAEEPSEETVRLVIAREHDFRDWAHALERGDDLIDPSFEAAVDAIVLGDVDALEALLRAKPALARARSSYGHRATLLHYVAANGVEHTRQRSPRNAPVVAKLLLDHGAEPDAQSDSYGGSCTTTLELLVSSCHPAEAGVQAELVDVLCRGGANPNGLEDDGAPLWTAITWGYTQSAERLAAQGARVDNLIAAAVVRDVKDLAVYFGADGRASPITELRGARHFSHGRPYDLGHLLEYALIAAASHGRLDVVEFLLTKAPDLDVKEPVYGNTAKSAARYPHPAAGRPKGSPEIVAKLDAARP